MISDDHPMFATGLDHIGVNVSDYAKSKEFYTAALTPLLMTFPTHCGFGRGLKPDFWLAAADGNSRPICRGLHVAFSASSKEVVDAWYEAAIAAGATDNGKPGMRPQYHPSYYGAFVLDPDGNNIEAVTHSARA